MNRPDIRHLGFRLLTSLFCLLTPALIYAQNYLLRTGSPTFTNAEPVEMGFINTANGNLHIEIPIASVPQRGSLPFTAKLVYDSRIWKVIRSGASSVWSPTSVSSSRTGWRFVTTGSGTVSNAQNQMSCTQYFPTYPYEYIYYWMRYENYRYKEPNGTERTFAVEYEVANNPCASVYYVTSSGPATDGSGYWMTLSGTTVTSVKAPDGTQVYPSMKDSNGNYFTTSGADVVDTLDRTPVMYESPGGSCTGTGVSYCLKLPNPQGAAEARIKVKTAKIDVRTAFGQSGVTEYRSQGNPSKQVEVITEIILPDNTSYAFTYEYGDVAGRYGVLSSMTLPTGSQISFVYTTFADAQGNRQRWVNYRSSGGGSWTYTPATCGTDCNKVTVNRPSGDATVYTFTINNGAWTTKAESYQGAVGGTLLSKVETIYKTDRTDPVNGGAGFVVPRTVTTTLPAPGGNLVKKVVYTFDDTLSFSYRGGNYTGGRGNLMRSQEYAFGSWGVGQMVRKTVLTYKHESDSNYTAKNIVNRVNNVQLQNSASNKQAETKITYDVGALIPETGVTHHDDANYGTGNTVRGNPTKIERWVTDSTYR